MCRWGVNVKIWKVSLPCRHSFARFDHLLSWSLVGWMEMRSQTEAFCASTFAFCYFSPPRKWGATAAAGCSQPEGEEKEGNGKFSLATERPCGRCNHRRCTARFYRRAFQLNSRQMCLRDAAGKVLGCKIHPNPSTSEGRQQTQDCLLPFISVYFIYCHRLHVHCAKRPPRGRLTTRSAAGARTCQPRNCTCRVSASACLRAWSWNLVNVTRGLFSSSLKGGSISHNKRGRVLGV